MASKRRKTKPFVFLREIKHAAWCHSRRSPLPETPFDLAAGRILTTHFRKRIRPGADVPLGFFPFSLRRLFRGVTATKPSETGSLSPASACTPCGEFIQLQRKNRVPTMHIQPKKADYTEATKLQIVLLAPRLYPLQVPANNPAIL